MTEPESDQDDGVEAQIVCADLGESLRHYTEDMGYEVDEVFPADSPRLIVVSRGDRRVRLELAPGAADAGTADGSGLPIVTSATAGTWTPGRAGMAYRDLIPGRCQGRVIASRIRIRDGGTVPDYVHFHHVAFQVIFCIRGWVRVVYEDQGPPFVMEAGDCVLQPPGIRHRVLECSDGLEVVEISAPAEHRTLADRATELPTPTLARDRLFAGQRFAFHRANSASWLTGPAGGWEIRDTGIGEASGGQGTVVVLRSGAPRKALRLAAGEDVSFQFMLQGSASLDAGDHGNWSLAPSDAFVVPPGQIFDLAPASDDVEILRVTLRGLGRGA